MARPLALALCLLALLLAAPAWVDRSADAQPVDIEAQPADVDERVAALEARVAELEANQLPPRPTVDVRRLLQNPAPGQLPFDPADAFVLYCVVRAPAGLDPMMTEALAGGHSIEVCARPSPGSALDFRP